MQGQRRPGTVIFASRCGPDPVLAQELEQHGLDIQWATSISATIALLPSARETTVIVTELALADGNWRDLMEQIRCSGNRVPIALVTSSTTAELWWDALECGVDEILHAPLNKYRLSQFLETHFAP